MEPYRSRSEALEKISVCAAMVRQAEQLLDDAVAEARARPRCTWLLIGRAAGMSHQAAHKRWAANVRSGSARDATEFRSVVTQSQPASPQEASPT